MGRGRSRFAQQTQGGRTSRYGLTGVPKNSRISVDMDKYRRGREEDRWVGTIVRRAASRCWIQWDGAEGVSEYNDADVRYWVDSGRARIQHPVKETLITKIVKGTD